MWKYLAEGLTDAAGFVIGSLLGYGLGQLLGLQLFAQGYSAGSIVAIAPSGVLVRNSMSSAAITVRVARRGSSRAMCCISSGG